MKPSRDNRTARLLGGGLVLAALALYWPTLRFGFINLDDPTYVLQNPKVSQGLTWSGVSWAFTNFYGANWHPLTWISHMMDVSLYGMRPMGHHATNVIFHAINTLLLFLWLRQMTGAMWRSAVVAGVFAWHPTHVESVAWVSERKDVLSLFFGLLALLAYTRYVLWSARTGPRFPTGRHVSQFQSGDMSPHSKDVAPSAITQHPPARFAFLRSPAYWLALLCFALGLMSKPMLVTWPFVMLLLDVWPLNRIRLESKVLSLKFWKQNQRLGLEKIPFFALTLGSCVLTFLAQRAGGAVQSMERLPWSARWENAVVSYARYLGKTFWPADLSAFYMHPVQWPDGVVLGAALLLVAMIALGLWKIRTQPYLLVGACWFLGTLVPVIGLIQVGGQSMADRYLYIPQIGILVAVVWGAAEFFRKSQRAQQAGLALSVAAVIACGVVTQRYLPSWKDSTALFQHVLTLDEKNPPALYSLGLALCTENKYDEAIPYLLKATALDPDIQIYQGQLALAYESKGDIAGAIERYRKCIELSPNLTEALNNLAWILATTPDAKLRNGADAVKFATRACELTQYDWPMFLGTLAAGYAEAGRFPEAIQTAEKAEQMARKRGFNELAERNAKLLELYRAGKPYREAEDRR